MIGQAPAIRRTSRPSSQPGRVNRSSAERRKIGKVSTVTDAIGAAAAARTWSSANFVSTAGHSDSDERRTARYGLRGLLRQKGVSALPRVSRCGMPLGNTPVPIRIGDGGAAHTSHVETCASIWSCPVCAAKIRAFRADEVSRALDGHLRGDGGALLVTLTLPHEVGDRLARTVALVSDGFRAVQRGRAYAAERETYGILGHIRAFEVTHSDEHGWHPHLHVVLVTDRKLEAVEAAELEAAWQERWDRWLVRDGWRASAWGVGVRVDRVWRPADAASVGAYVAKVQEGKDPRKAGVGSEVTRADLKFAARGSRTPFEILADFGSAGLEGVERIDVDKTTADLELWQEYQTATKGRSAIRWSKGLHALLLPDEPDPTDQEIVDAPVPGSDIVAVVPAGTYRRIAHRPYGEALMLIAVEKGGYSGLVRYVKSLGIDTRGILTREASLQPDSGDEE